MQNGPLVLFSASVYFVPNSRLHREPYISIGSPQALYIYFFMSFARFSSCFLLLVSGRRGASGAAQIVKRRPVTGVLFAGDILT